MTLPLQNLCLEWLCLTPLRVIAIAVLLVLRYRIYVVFSFHPAWLIHLVKGQFQVNLAGTGFVVSSRSTWNNYGRYAVQDIRRMRVSSMPDKRGKSVLQLTVTMYLEGRNRDWKMWRVLWSMPPWSISRTGVIARGWIALDTSATFWPTKSPSWIKWPLVF